MLDGSEPDSPAFVKFLHIVKTNLKWFLIDRIINKKLDKGITLTTVLLTKTYKVTMRANCPLEHVTPVHEFSLGKQGSPPLQSEGGLSKFLASSSMAITEENYKNLNGYSNAKSNKSVV